MAAKGPELKVTVSIDGVQRIVVTNDPGGKAAGLGLLRQAIPILAQLDEVLNKGEGARSK